jgi:hypothetical protein
MLKKPDATPPIPLAARLDKPQPAPPVQAIHPVLSARLFGANARAKRRWNKERPVRAIIGDAMAQSCALLERLERGMYAPYEERKEHYQAVLHDLYLCTQYQLKALDAFSELDWGEQ